MTTMTKPMATTEVVRDGWFYLPTFLRNGDQYRNPDACSLFVRHAQVRRGKTGRTWATVGRDVLRFPDEAAMVRWIDEHKAEELPAEADGNPRYIPTGYRKGDF